MKRQPRSKFGPRDVVPACVQRDITLCVEHTAAKFNVSKSWVVAEILAEFFGVKIDAPAQRSVFKRNAPAARRSAQVEIRMTRKRT